MRRHFARRMLLALLLFLGLMFTASAVAVALLSGALGLGERRGLVVTGAILGLSC